MHHSGTCAHLQSTRERLLCWGLSQADSLPVYFAVTARCASPARALNDAASTARLSYASNLRHYLAGVCCVCLPLRRAPPACQRSQPCVCRVCSETLTPSIVALSVRCKLSVSKRPPLKPTLSRKIYKNTIPDAPSSLFSGVYSNPNSESSKARVAFPPQCSATQRKRADPQLSRRCGLAASASHTGPPAPPSAPGAHQ